MCLVHKSEKEKEHLTSVVFIIAGYFMNVGSPSLVAGISTKFVFIN